MKHEKWLSCLMGSVLSFAGGVAGVGCVITAFGFGHLVSLPGVILLLAAWAVAVSLLLMLPQGGKWLAALSVLLLGILLYQKDILLQVESFLNKISLVYNAAYGCGMIIWSDKVQPDMPVTWAMILMGGLVELGICWSVCRRKWLALGTVAGFVPLILCSVVTDTIPEEGYLFLLLSTQVLMIMPYLSGRVTKANGIRLTAMLLVPVLVGMLVLFAVVKPENYGEQSAKFQQTVAGIMQKLPFGTVTTPGGNPGITVGGIAMDRVDLSAVGPQSRQTYAVMDVVAPTTKTLYLRGQALDSYNGTSWSLGPGGNQTDPYWPYTGISYRGKMEITTRAIQPLKFLPYYTGESWAQQENGMAVQQQNDGLQTVYTTFLWVPTLGGNMYSVMNSMSGTEVYLNLPASTRQRAEAILNGLLTYERTMKEKAETIRYYVETSARYDLNTQAMPEGETDFALWFLEKSDSGYCTHFASAAAVLLRAAGIPARYVTGYTVNTINGRRVTVTAEQAHAWVEYLDEDMVWKVLEATPVDYNNSQPRPTVPHPTQRPTEPSEETTEPTVDTTEPTQDTTQSTAPSDPNAPTTRPTDETTRPTDASTRPTGGNAGEEPEEKPDLSWLWPIVKAILWVGGIVLLLAAQYLLRLRHRRKAMYTGGKNHQAIRRWRYAKLLARRLRCNVPERLDFLADKAAYSQHTLTSQELAEFDSWLEEKRLELQRWPLLSKLFVKLVFALE